MQSKYRQYFKFVVTYFLSVPYRLTSYRMDRPLPASIPKSVAPFLARAKELQARDPVVAYWCAWHPSMTRGTDDTKSEY